MYNALFFYYSLIYPGETTSFMDWAWGQPDQIMHGKRRFLVPIEEDCVVMRYQEWGHWHDVPCGRPYINPYICEYGRKNVLQQIQFCC